MIIWLNNLARMKAGSEQINRIGYLQGKDYALHRSFDHIAFSLFTGDVYVMLKDKDEEIIIDRPACIMAVPGDVRNLVPLRPVDEFFFVYPASSMPYFFPDEDYRRRRTKVIPLQDCPMVSAYAEMMKEILAYPLNSSRCSQLDLLGEAILSESFVHVDSAERTSADKVIRDIENYIYRHYHENPDWEKIAGEHGISYSGFRRLWGRTHMISPHAYVMELRNREACELLKDHDLPIARIAELVGYTDPRYFCRFFYRKNGMSPTEFRKAHNR